MTDTRHADAEPGRDEVAAVAALAETYKTLRGEKLWVITEAADDDGHRSATTILLPEQY